MKYLNNNGTDILIVILILVLVSWGYIIHRDLQERNGLIAAAIEDYNRVTVYGVNP